MKTQEENGMNKIFNFRGQNIGISGQDTVGTNSSTNRKQTFYQSPVQDISIGGWDCATNSRYLCALFFWHGSHRWGLSGDYPIFTLLMVICHYIDRIGDFLLLPLFWYNIYDREIILLRWTSSYIYTIINKYYSGEQLGNYHQEMVRLN